MQANFGEELETLPLDEYLSSLERKSTLAKNNPSSKRPRDPEVARLLGELQEWCEQERGRQTEVAKVLGVDRKRLYDWFSGRISPTLAVGLRIQGFLRMQKGQKRKRAESQA